MTSWLVLAEIGITVKVTLELFHTFLSSYLGTAELYVSV